MKDLNKIGFQDKGFPYYGWLISIFTSVLKIAVSMNIDLIVYADGEVEYGGSNLTKDKPFLMLYTQKIYFEGGYDKVLKKIKAKDSEKAFLSFQKMIF